MKAIVKNKIAGLLVILLLVANLVSLAVFWLGKEKRLPCRAGKGVRRRLFGRLCLEHHRLGSLAVQPAV